MGVYIFTKDWYLQQQFERHVSDLNSYDLDKCQGHKAKVGCWKEGVSVPLEEDILKLWPAKALGAEHIHWRATKTAWMATSFLIRVVCADHKIITTKMNGAESCRERG